MMYIPPNHRQRGSALVTVIIFGVIMTVCAMFAYRSTMFQNRMAARSQNYMSALAVAEAGAELAMVEINKDPSATPAAFTGWTGTNTKTFSQQVRDNKNNLIGETEVSVSDLDSGKPKVVSTGFVPNKKDAQLARTVQLTAKVNTIPSPFGGFGIFSFNDINIKGASTLQSYDASKNDGIYWASLGDKANMAAIGDISMNGASTVRGNMQAGGKIDLKGAVNVTGKKSSKTKPTEPPALPQPDISREAPSNNNNIDIDLRDSRNRKIIVPSTGSGKNATNEGSYAITFKAPGTYVLDNFNLNGAGKFKVTGSGDVNIYVKDEFNLNGVSDMDIGDGNNVRFIAKDVNFNGSHNLNFNGNSQVEFVAENVKFNGATKLTMPDNEAKLKFLVDNDLRFNGATTQNAGQSTLPGNLQFFVGGDFTYNGATNLVCSIYAPNADFTMNGASIFRGVIVAGDIRLNGAAQLYVDESVLQPSGGSGAYVTSWLETTPKK